MFQIQIKIMKVIKRKTNKHKKLLYKKNFKIVIKQIIKFVLIKKLKRIEITIVILIYILKTNNYKRIVKKISVNFVAKINFVNFLKFY